MRSLNLIVLIIVVLCPVAFADDGAKQFSVDLPDDWRDAARIRLVLENITTPANRAFKLRVTTKSGSETIVLGSAPIEAIGRDRTGTRSIPSIRLDVTRALKRLLGNSADVSRIQIVVQAVGPRNEPVKGFEWNLKRVVFESS
jgi:hypothetical protein